MKRFRELWLKRQRLGSEVRLVFNEIIDRHYLILSHDMRCRLRCNSLPSVSRSMEMRGSAVEFSAVVVGFTSLSR